MSFFGDPYGNRTHVTAVKGRCLNRLTNGPGSGDLIRTGDIPGMNRLLYQLSYAAIWPSDFGIAEISFVIIYRVCRFVKKNFCIFPEIFGNAHNEVTIMGILKCILFFGIGGTGYMALEWLWRGWSHGSMFLAGGCCFLLLGKLNAVQPRLPLPLRGLAGAGIITMVELLAGLLFNREYRVWDYRHLPLNFHGQICLRFFLLWIPISLLAMYLYGHLDRRIGKKHRGAPGQAAA